MCGSHLCHLLQVDGGYRRSHVSLKIVDMFARTSMLPGCGGLSFRPRYRPFRSLAPQHTCSNTIFSCCSSLMQSCRHLGQCTGHIQAHVLRRVHTLPMTILYGASSLIHIPIFGNIVLQFCQIFLFLVSVLALFCSEYFCPPTLSTD